MPRWLSIILAVLSGLYAFQQMRLFRIYRAQTYSPAIGALEPNRALSANAIRAAVTFALIAFLFLLVSWPQVLTYIAGLWVCRGVVDVFLCWSGRGQFSVTAAMLTDKGRRSYLLNAAAKVVGAAVLFGTCVYFFGL
jgi:hypothetical protein